MKLSSMVYCALISGASLFSGCSSAPASPKNDGPAYRAYDAPEEPESKSEVIPVANADLSKNFIEPAPIEAVSSQNPLTSSRSDRFSYRVEFSSADDALRANSIPLDERIDLYSYLPVRFYDNSLNPDLVTFHFEEPSTNDLSDKVIVPGMKVFNYEKVEFRSAKIGARELRVALYVVREAVRRLGKEYSYVRHVDNAIRIVEFIGDYFQGIYKGIEEIWKIDLDNFVEDITDPFAHLRHAIYRTRPHSKKRAKGPVFRGSLEPTLNGHPFGSKPGQDFLSLLEGDLKSADLGASLGFRVDF
ncbi:hypothetical protein D6825_00615 [Candidatus Woesearchaeota archaeon]|nr:MAG: hypothetical protein D6825_00615 [Candidatus Woesearchaeota archaeon]